jgi:hypothetical protein
MNDDKTRNEGVFVINRYDWGSYDRRGQEEVGLDHNDPYPFDDEEAFDHREDVGLVDYGEARNQTQAWMAMRPGVRCTDPVAHSLFMHIPQSEYRFARFGFDESYSRARSFLLFTTYTVFYRTAFAGSQTTLRKLETPAERFERRLREGFDFSGISELIELTGPPRYPHAFRLPPPPPDSELLGPYDPGRDHILHAEDLDALRCYKPFLSPGEVESLLRSGVDVARYEAQYDDEAIPQLIPELTPQLREVTADLLNEMVLSYLERLLPLVSEDVTAEGVAEVLFPDHHHYSETKWLDKRAFDFFTQPQKAPIAGYDLESVAHRIKEFLRARTEGEWSAAFDRCMAGASRMVAFLMAELLRLAGWHCLGSNRGTIEPHDIRSQACRNEELWSVLQYSVVLWKGRVVLSAPPPTGAIPVIHDD